MRRLLTAGVAVIFAVASGGGFQPARVPSGWGVLKVAVAKPLRKTLRRTSDQPGTITALEETPVFARVPGYVAKVAADIGDAVKAGAALAELAVPELADEAAVKEAEVAKAG